MGAGRTLSSVGTLVAGREAGEGGSDAGSGGLQDKGDCAGVAALRTKGRVIIGIDSKSAAASIGQLRHERGSRN